MWFGQQLCGLYGQQEIELYSRGGLPKITYILKKKIEVWEILLIKVVRMTILQLFSRGFELNTFKKQS